MNMFYDYVKKFIFFCIFFSPPVSIFAGQPQQEIRALWVTRWDYQSPEDIENIVRNAAECHFNVILFQVRGTATVFYPSKIEPWAKELGGSYPGWNPLTTAIELAHDNGLQLHAWINVFPMWGGTEAPNDSNHLFNRKPQWLMVNEDQIPMPLNSHYVWINPLLPDVQNYLKDVVVELASTPDLDGIHFDYFRFPGPGFSYDNRSLHLFQQQFHIQARDSTELWDRFRRETVTKWLREVYTQIKEKKPELAVSSTVIGDYDIGASVFFQDAHQWLAQGIIDMIFPMTYTTDTRMLKRWLKRHAAHSKNRLICPGLMFRNETLLKKQLSLVRELKFPGFSIYSYSLLFPEHQPNRMVDFLSDSLLIQPASLPDFTKKQKVKLISEIHTFPEYWVAGDSVRVVCKIKDIAQDSVYSVFGIILQEGLVMPNLTKFRLQQLDQNPDYWFTRKKIRLQSAGENYFLQIFAYQNGQLQKTNFSSDYLHKVVDFSAPHYRSMGEFGPLLTMVSRATVDQSNAVWVIEPHTGIRVIDSDGSEAAFSPLITFTDERGYIRPLTSIAALATMNNNEVAALINSSSQAFIVTNQNDRTRLETYCHLPLSGIDLAVSQNQFFVLQSNGWFVADKEGIVLWRYLFEESHTVNNITVSPDGRTVLIACRTEGAVHRWERMEQENLVYNRMEDLPVLNMGLGGVTYSTNGTIFLAETPGGYIKILDRQFQPIDFLLNGEPALRAPRLVVASPDNQYLYILETTGTTPMRMIRWKRIAQ